MRQLYAIFPIFAHPNNPHKTNQPTIFISQKQCTEYEKILHFRVYFALSILLQKSLFPSSKGSFSPAVDVFTFLLCMESRDVVPYFETWLPSSVIRWISPLLKDQSSTKNGRSERSFPKTLSAHYMAWGASLIATTAQYFKPTPFASAWIGTSEQEHIQILWNTAFSKESLWIKMKLPGWRFLSSAQNGDRPFTFEDILVPLRV